MPWHVVDEHPQCPASKPYGVVKDDDGEVEGCHRTRDEANDQMAALYASESRGADMNQRTFALAEVKAVQGPDTSKTGEFEAVLSAPTLDRDGEVVAKGAFNPLPQSLPIHAFHDFTDPIGRGVPYYDADMLKVRGIFASTPRAQEVRTLVAEGVIGHMSVGFMSAVRREGKDGTPEVTKAELLEGSFVSVPSNRDAAVLVAKGYAEGKIGARNSAKDQEFIQSTHDALIGAGAVCGGKGFTHPTDPEAPAAAPAAAGSPAEVTALAQAKTGIARIQAELFRMP